MDLVSLKFSHKGVDFVGNILLIKRKLPRMNRELQSVIEIFIWVVLRGVGWEKNYLDLFLMFVQPGCNELTMMYFQIVQNQKYFLFRGAD